jgi:DNA-binding TFAR19-related protein (PDSD5 family)
MMVIRFNPDELNEKMIQEIVKKHTGVSIRLDLRNVEIYKLDRSENIEAKLVELEKSGYQKD